MIQRRVLPTFKDETTVVGIGATASVYRKTVVHPGGFTKLKPGDQIAIKVLHAVQLQTLPLIEREVAMHKALHHPCIVRCFGCFIPPESNNTSSSNSSTNCLTTQVHLLMELCEGGSLELRKLPPAELALSLHRAVKALVYLHDNEIVHRDIKGANLMLTKGGHCKLGDFGAATDLATRPQNQFESAKGTINWMAPEQFEGSGGTTAADIWSLGATAWELGTGAPPFPSCNAFQVVYFVQNVTDESEFFTPENTAGMSSVLLDFVSRCLKRDPCRRPTARELLRHPLFADVESATVEKSVGSNSGDDVGNQSTEQLHQMFTGLAANMQASNLMTNDGDAAAAVETARDAGEDVVPHDSPSRTVSRASSDEEASMFADALAWWQTEIRTPSCAAFDFFTALRCVDLMDLLLPIVTFPQSHRDSASPRVSMGDFILFVHWFGPFSVLRADARALGDTGATSYGHYYGNYAEEGDAPRVLPTWHSKPWMKPTMSKEESEAFLKRRSPGAFVIRFSGQWRESPGSFTLSMKGDRGVTHHRITRPRGSWSYTIHAHSSVPRLYFDSLEDLVSYYQQVGLHNVKGDKTYRLEAS